MSAFQQAALAFLRAAAVPCALGAGLLALRGNALFAQDAPTASQPRLLLSVSVTDPKGNPVSGLTQADFSATDNGHPVPILGLRVISPAQAPTYEEAIFVLDGVNLSFIQMSQAREQLGQYLGSHPHLPLLSTVLVASDTAEQVIAQPSHDGKLLQQEVKSAASSLRVLTRSAGGVGAGERLETSLREFDGLVESLGKQPGRKLVIWISSGWPFLDGPAFANRLSQNQLRQQFALEVALTNELRTSGVVLDTVDPRGTYGAFSYQALDYRSLLKGVRKPSEMETGNLGAQVLAVQSGGLVLNSSNNIAGELAQCIDQRMAYYTLELPAAGSSETPEYHQLAIKLASRGLAVHTTSGYYTTP